MIADIENITGLYAAAIFTRAEASIKACFATAAEDRRAIKQHNTTAAAAMAASVLYSPLRTYINDFLYAGRPATMISAFLSPLPQNLFRWYDIEVLLRR